MFRNFAKKLPLIGTAAALTGSLLIAGRQLNKNEADGKKTFGDLFRVPVVHAKNYSRRLYPASAEFPHLKKHRNMMARCLTSDLYARLRDLSTKNGFTIDDAIQTGVDNVGLYSFTGLVAGDEDSYLVVYLSLSLSLFLIDL